MKASKAAHLLDRVAIFKQSEACPWNGCGTITTDGTILLAAWYTGGYKEPHPENRVVLSRSFDRGGTWSPPTIVSDPEGDLRAGDPMAWQDGENTTHFTWGHHDHYKATGDWTYFHMRCDDLSAEQLEWTEAKPITPESIDFMLNNKTIPLRNGGYLSPIAIRTGNRKLSPYHEGFTRAGALLTLDRGQTWRLIGQTPDMPRSGYGPSDITLWEPGVIETEDGTLRFYVRNSWGLIHTSYSSDGGKTWSDWEPTNMPNPSSRFHIRKIPEGPVICLNNPNSLMGSMPDRKQRSPLAIHISYDEGVSFARIVILDPRVGMYPDAALDPDGHTLHIFYENRIDVFYAALDLNEIL